MSFGNGLGNGFQSGAGAFAKAVGQPSLNLNFLSGTLDPRITFTRASLGSYFDSSGVLRYAATNSPRFDYDPVTHAPRGLLIEEQRTNLLLQSDNLTTSWTAASASVSNMSHTRWDGASTTSKLTEDTSNSTHSASQSCTITAGNTLTIWTVVESVGGRHVRLQVSSDSSTNGFRAYFDLVNGVVGVASQGFGTGTAVANSATIRPLGGGKFLVAVSGRVDPAATTALCNVFLQQVPSGTALYTGDGTSGLWIHASQLEAGAFPTSYIPTSGSTVTRAADNAIMTGTAFSSWYNQSAGTFVAKYENDIPASSTTSFERPFSCGDGTSNNELRLQRNSTGFLIWRAENGGAISALVNTPKNASGLIKAAAGYDASTLSLSVDGASVISASVAAGLPNCTKFTIGAATSGSSQFSGHIQFIRCYPRRLPNSILQAITV